MTVIVIDGGKKRLETTVIDKEKDVNKMECHVRFLLLTNENSTKIHPKCNFFFGYKPSFLRQLNLTDTFHLK